MTTPTKHDTPAPTVMIVAGTVMFCFVIAGCVSVFIAAPEGANTGSLVALLIGALAPTLASLAVLAKVQGVDEKADRTSREVSAVRQDTYALTNGLLDAKVRAAVADVAHPSFIRPDAAEQIAADRAVRESASGDRPEPNMPEPEVGP